jgi:transcriptional regulator with XRE-family HTH domain
MNANKRLVALLKTAGATHEELSKEAGLSTRQITRILAGTSVPSAKTISRWCQTFGIDSCVAMVDRPSMLDVVLVGMASLTDDEMKFVCRFIGHLTNGERDSS